MVLAFGCRAGLWLSAFTAIDFDSHQLGHGLHLVLWNGCVAMNADMGVKIVPIEVLQFVI